jgi:hypothetical protein
MLRRLLSNEYGPFDRLVELGVFVFVGYEVIAGWWHRRQGQKRYIELSAIKQDGNRLLRGFAFSFTQSADERERERDWIESVKTWIQGTALFLRKRSAKASLAFLPEDVEEISFSTPHGTTWKYLLEERLNTLGEIMDSVDKFF